jgi:hypothetical protein
VQFWPFDGWDIAGQGSVVAEVYPTLWRRHYTVPPEWSGDQRDAFVISSRLRDLDAAGTARSLFTPPGSEAVRKAADVEGWILGA